MMAFKNKAVVLVWVWVLSSFLANGQVPYTEDVDVVSYDVTIEPDIAKKSIDGIVKINFTVDAMVFAVAFNCGSLVIDRVAGEHIRGFRVQDGKLIIEFSQRSARENEITITYHGQPSGGIHFNAELNEAYTVFSTSQWMVCNESPKDRAKFSVHLLLPAELKCVASGELVEKVDKAGKTHHYWRQNYETPAYTFGFSVGQFNRYEESAAKTTLQYFATQYSPDELREIFTETRRMLSFMEARSGIPYYQDNYSQILIGQHYQEMSGFAVLKHDYGRLVLQDSTETNLISHELAHQWWGNRITCISWGHFWLNEGFATYMSAAYNEHRFGKWKYDADIDAYVGVYEDLKKRGRDRSLVFDNWLSPTKDDRNLVYFKGAYVLHLLRKEIGDQAFWNGVRSYTMEYFGKNVSTDDFQHSMERSSGINLDAFFNKWVYLTSR